MISAETFLEQQADRRRQAQAEALQLLPVPQDAELPPELMIAANFGGLVSPVLARSVYAPLSAYIGSPSSNPVQLLQWFAAYPECNWSLSTGVEAGIIATEFDFDLTQESLAHLFGDEGDLSRALRFETAQACFALFVLPARRIRPRFNRIAGVRVHCGDRILIPPSVVLGRRLVYVDPSARFAATPRWLLSSAHDARSFV